MSQATADDKPQAESKPRLIWVVETSDGGVYAYPTDEWHHEENQIGILFRRKDQPLSFMSEPIEFMGFYTFYPWDHVVRFSGTSEDQL